MPITYTQTDNAITFEVGCSGRTAGVTTAGRQLIEAGTPGVTDVSVDPGNNTEAAVFALATIGGVGEATWEAGDYVVNLNISGANGTSQWTETHICERTAGGAFNTVASLTGQTTDVSAAGIVSHTVNRGTDFTPAGTDSDLYIVIVLSNSDQHGNSTTSITPDQDVTTPITTSGTTFTQAVAGSITASGTLTRKTGKALSGSSTPSGGLTRKVSKALAGSVTASGALTRKVVKGLSGSITAAGSLTRKTAKAFAGSITASGDLASRIVIQTTLTGSITPSGTVGKKIKKSLGGVVTASGVLVRKTAKGLGGTVTAAGALVKKTARALSGSITPSGALSTGFRTFKSLAGSITAAGTVVGNLVVSGGETAARFVGLLLNFGRGGRR